MPTTPIYEDLIALWAAAERKTAGAATDARAADETPAPLLAKDEAYPRSALPQE